MKNKQIGFIAPIIIVIVALLGIGSGVFVYSQKSISKNVNLDNTTQTESDAVNSATSTSSAINTDEKTSLENTERKDTLEKSLPKSTGSNMMYTIGLNGKVLIDTTNLQYPKCKMRPNEAKTFSRPVDLSSKTGLVVKEEDRFYEVTGVDIGQLYYETYNCLILIEGLSSGVNKANAVSETDINYDIKYDLVNNQACNISNVAVGLHMSYLLPRWTRKAEASGELLKRWNQYSLAITKHERNHGDISKQYANNLLSYLNELSKNKTCVSLDTISDKYNSIIGELNDAQTQYDSSVRSGVDEGIYEYLSPPEWTKN